jgi:hypothetical protein
MRALIEKENSSQRSGFKRAVLLGNVADRKVYGQFARLLEAIRTGTLPLNGIRQPEGIDLTEVLHRITKKARLEGHYLDAEVRKLRKAPLTVLMEDLAELRTLIEKKQGKIREIADEKTASDLTIGLCYVVQHLTGRVIDLMQMENEVRRL